MSCLALLDQLRLFIADPDEECRRSAVVRIGEQFPKEGRTLLIRALGDVSWRVRKEAVAALLATPGDRELVTLLVAALGSDDNAGLRNSALETLAGLDCGVTDALIDCLDGAAEDIRKFIIEVLGLVGGTSAQAALKQALTDPDSNVAVAAAEGLARLGSPEALPALIRALEQGDVWLQYAVLEAIAATGQPQAVPAVLSRAGDRNLRGAVIDCLGAIGDRTAIPLLMEGVEDPSPRLALAAVQALARTRSRLTAAEQVSLDSDLRQKAGTRLPLRLVEMLETGAEGHEQIVALLGSMGDHRTAGALMKAARVDQLRSAVADAVAEWQDLSPLMGQIYCSEDEEGRRFLLAFSAEIPRFDGSFLVHAALADLSPAVRCAALTAVARGDYPSCVPAVGSLCHDPSDEVRDEALRTLCYLAERHPAAINIFARELAGAMQPDLRRGAALLFTRTGAHEDLVHLSGDDDAGVRSAALVGIGSLNSVDAAHRLALALTDEVPRVRAAAAEGLGMLAGEASPALLVALTDDDGTVVRAALRALSGGGKQVIAAVQECLRRADGLNLIEALETVARLDRQGAPVILAPYLGSGDEEVAVTALRLLGDVGDTTWYLTYGAAVCGHTSWEIRAQAAVVLGRMPGTRATLEQMLVIEMDPLVRERILASLAGID